MNANANWSPQSGAYSEIGPAAPETGGQRQELAVNVNDVGRPAAPETEPRKVLRRYTFKLYPNKAQEAALTRQASLLASLWNAGLEQREVQWAHECQFAGRGERSGLSWYDQKRELKLIRAADPEYAAMSSSSMELCLKALDDAFKAFFKRAKGGAGKSSGYPRYKSPYAIENKGADCTIWHRENRKGWRLDPSGRNFRVYAKGVPGMIRARGRFPVAVDDLEIRDMRLVRVGGIWQLSVVVRMDARRAVDATAPKATIEFDLIDEFASVKGANGECLPGWDAGFISADERICSRNERLKKASAAEASDFGADDRAFAANCQSPDAAEASDFGADDRSDGRGFIVLRAAEASDFGADDRKLASLLGGWAAEASGVQSTGDTRFKRGSYRWKKNRKVVARLKAKEARQRKDALHRYTTSLVASVSELVAVCPPIRDSTKSAKGNEKFHGAAVKTVAMLNRHVLGQAPAMAIQMLEYKAAEAGIQFARVTPDEHKIAIGRDLPETVKAVRKTRRIIRKERELLNV